MRRPRAGDERSSRAWAAPGLRPGALRPPARSSLTAGRQASPRLERCSHPKGAGISEAEAGRNGPSESAARRRQDAAMERRTARTRRHGCPRRKRMQVAQTAYTCLRWRGLTKDAPLGAPSPRILRGAKKVPGDSRRRGDKRRERRRPARGRKEYGRRSVGFLSSPRRRGPIRRALSIDCRVWVPALAEFVIGPRFARTRWLGLDDSKTGCPLPLRHRMIPRPTLQTNPKKRPREKPT
jgi:hypothetical protein